MIKWKLVTNNWIVLLLIIFSIVSCQDSNSDQVIIENADKSEIESLRDSVNIKFVLPPNEFAKLNNNHSYFNISSVHFKNNNDYRDTVTIKIAAKKYHALNYRVVVSKNKKFVRTITTLLFTPSHKEVILEMDSTLQINKVYPKNLLIADSIFDSYEPVRAFNYKNPRYSSISYLKEIYDDNNKRYQDSTLLAINEFEYYSWLSTIDPRNKSVWDYFVRYNDQDFGIDASRSVKFSIAREYGKNMDSLLQFTDIGTDESLSRKFTEGAIALLAVKDYQSKPEYADLLKWLKQTTLYQNDPSIAKAVNPLSKIKFKRLFNKILLQPSQHSPSKFNKKDSYYLVDFWATWCAPCIQGIHTMNEMALPSNVQVVSISVDEDQDYDKWQQKTKELKQKLSYRLSTSVEENREFLNFVELETIPRYILMDKDFNLIDQAFYHPQEPQFLPKLKDINNYKRW